MRQSPRQQNAGLSLRLGVPAVSGRPAAESMVHCSPRAASHCAACPRPCHQKKRGLQVPLLGRSGLGRRTPAVHCTVTGARAWRARKSCDRSPRMFTCAVRHGPHRCLACWPARRAAVRKPVRCSVSGSDTPACTGDVSLQPLVPIHTAKAVGGTSHHLRPKKGTKAVEHCNSRDGSGAAPQARQAPP